MKSRKYKLFLVFFAALFSFTSCGTHAQHQFIPKSEQKRFREFFKKMLFLEGAVYTLYGSKPITEFILSTETPEEKSALQEQALNALSKKELAQLRASSFEYEEEYWFEETWAMWENMLKTLPIRRYLFVERKVGIPEAAQKHRYIYFINIAETAKILQKHYSLFREYVDFDFDPLSVVIEAENPNSSFWNAFWGGKTTDKKVCLIGILFGYGFENSYPYSLYFSLNKNPEKDAFIESLIKAGVPTVPIEAAKKFNPPKSFLLPGYISFSEFDSQKEQYKHEYEIIRQRYMQSDIIECTMKRLLN